MRKPEKFDDLVSLYLDEALDAEGVAKLNSLLAARPKLASRFVHLGRIHGGLRELGNAPPFAKASPEEAGRLLVDRAEALRLRRRLFSYVSIGLAAAGLLAILLVLLLKWLVSGK